jgi:hypothetical protein
MQIKMAWAVVALIIVLAVANFAWYRLRRPSTPQLTRQDVAEEMKLRAKLAVDTAATDFDVTLDYTPASIEKVEGILARIHDQHSASPLERAQLTKQALKWGAYVGEVIKTQKRSEWALDSAVGGPGSLPIVYDNKSESFPVRWCYNRIVNGREDNVWHKFTIIVLDRENFEAAITPPDSPHN